MKEQFTWLVYFKYTGPLGGEISASVTVAADTIEEAITNTQCVRQEKNMTVYQAQRDGSVIV